MILNYSDSMTTSGLITGKDMDSHNYLNLNYLNTKPKYLLIDHFLSEVGVAGSIIK
jgi:hypothetical protein